MKYVGVKNIGEISINGLQGNYISALTSHSTKKS